MQASLLLGEQAPLFSARSTEGDFLFENFREKWLFLLFCHEAFDTIATTEIISLNRSIKFFSDYKCQPLIITSSSLFSNLAWIYSIYQQNGEQIDLPVLEDPTCKIFEAYQGSNHCRKNRFFFLIDPYNTIRWMCHYPSSIGLSIEEVLRTLSALQHSDQNNTLIPVNWRPGEKSFSETAFDRKTMISIGEKWFYPL